MSRRTLAWLTAALTSLLGACSGATQDHQPVAQQPAAAATVATITVTPEPSISEEARAYLMTALDFMEQNSVRRTVVDWTEVQREALERARDAGVPRDIYPTIRAALARLGDHHSLFATPEMARSRIRAPVTARPAGSGWTAISTTSTCRT